MAYARVPPPIRGVRGQRGTRLGSYPGSGLQRHLLSPCGQRRGAFPVSPVSMTFDPLALAVVGTAPQALSTSLTRVAAVVCPSAKGAV
jgi:hypothetical protein